MKLPSNALRRDSVLFIGGLLGIGYETIGNDGERPTLLILFGAMVGLPAFLPTDEKAAAPPPEPALPSSLLAPEPSAGLLSRHGPADRASPPPGAPQ